MKHVRPKTVVQAAATIGLGGVGAAGSVVTSCALLDYYHDNQDMKNQLASESKTEQTESKPTKDVENSPPSPSD
jgi:hypothetical protein